MSIGTSISGTTIGTATSGIPGTLPPTRTHVDAGKTGEGEGASTQGENGIGIGTVAVSGSDVCAGAVVVVVGRTDGIAAV